MTFNERTTRLYYDWKMHSPAFSAMAVEIARLH